MISKITYWLKNKYAYTLLFFIIWVCFIDQNNIMTAYTYNVELKKLETEKTYFNEAIEKTSKELFDLTENPATLEKFARENYFMKKEGEEVFVFTTE
ncbi:MAG: septum formation initiator family protein [Flavobacteriales bacterium]